MERKKMMELSTRQFETGYWIPRQWLMDWRRSVDTTDQSEALDPNICREITCKHGGLSHVTSLRKLIPVDLWSYLRAFYPEGPEFSHLLKPCEDCIDEESDRRILRQTRRDERNQEKVS